MSKFIFVFCAILAVAVATPKDYGYDKYQGQYDVKDYGYDKYQGQYDAKDYGYDKYQGKYDAKDYGYDKYQGQYDAKDYGYDKYQGKYNAPRVSYSAIKAPVYNDKYAPAPAYYPKYEPSYKMEVPLAEPVYVKRPDYSYSPKAIDPIYVANKYPGKIVAEDGQPKALATAKAHKSGLSGDYKPVGVASYKLLASNVELPAFDHLDGKVLDGYLKSGQYGQKYGRDYEYKH